MSYEFKVNKFNVYLAAVQTKCTGFPRNHVTAYPGDYILEFPFDGGGIHSGQPLQIPISAAVFEQHFKGSEITGVKSGEGEQNTPSPDMPDTGFTETPVIQKRHKDAALTTEEKVLAKMGDEERLRAELSEAPIVQDDKARSEAEKENKKREADEAKEAKAAEKEEAK